jgi:putative FmdB family regulatory protein
MPIHGYKCSACGEIRDYYHHFDDDPKKCDTCGEAGEMEKQFDPCTNFKGQDGMPTFDQNLSRDMTAKNKRLKKRAKERKFYGEKGHVRGNLTEF